MEKAFLCWFLEEPRAEGPVEAEGYVRPRRPAVDGKGQVGCVGVFVGVCVNVCV